jgi:hypothetical protein
VKAKKFVGPTWWGNMSGLLLHSQRSMENSPAFNVTELKAKLPHQFIHTSA